MTNSSDIIERFSARDPGDTAAGRELIGWLKAELQAGRTAAVAECLPRLISPDLDYTTALSLLRIVKQVRAASPAPKKRPKIAVLGSVTTHQLAEFLDLQLQAGRITPELYEADYGTLHQELLDRGSALHRFAPDFIVLVPTWRDLEACPDLTDGREAVDAKVRAEVSRWEALWRIAREELKSQVIQSNFAAPPWRTLGNLESRHAGGFAGYVAKVNAALAAAAPPEVTIHDADHLAASAGRWQWSDERFYHQAKLPCAPEHLVDYAHSLAALILAQLGVARKCLVLDLDNTLWGGVIGDDGLEGIRLGQGEPEAEAFAAFQRYVKQLGRRGVILAVCSKNTESIAREAFEKHPEMVLKLEDISCFMANWDDKATNLARIAERLNIGLNSLVFFDDNPAERSIIRQLRPEVAVPEVPQDPAYYIQALDRRRYFEALAISNEDLQRNEFYRSDSERQSLESSATDLESFLRSLDMSARIEPVTALTLERSVQLINRSNQFNLTTRRYSNADVAGFMQDPSWVTRTVALRDRFGDSGLISVLLARVESDALVIDTWLMSCRVLKRGVEKLALNSLVREAERRHLARIVGEYIPSAKNALVRDHYLSLGFTEMGPSQQGGTLFELRTAGDWAPQIHFIKETADGSA